MSADDDGRDDGPREGQRYRVSDAQRDAFRRDGYVHLPGVLAPDELAEIAVTYERFLSGAIPVPGKDFCDMSGRYGGDPADYALINVMLPRRYHPAWADNLFERRAASIAAQLQGPGMVLDYDQLLAKRPGRADAVFAWHQDMAYWIDTPDTATATVWLALDASTLENGCLAFVPGSQAEPSLRSHKPLHGERGDSHALATELRPGDVVAPVPIAAGDVTVHDERVLHGSGGNRSDGWRRAYVVAFRRAATVAEERRRGFTHSHEDQGPLLEDVGVPGQTRPPDG